MKFNFAKNADDTILNKVLNAVDDQIVKDKVRLINIVNKGDSPIWQSFSSHKGKTKTNGLTGKNKQYYEWDFTHKDIEVYNQNGSHLGTMDPISGEMYKPAVAKRIINLN